ARGETLLFTQQQQQPAAAADPIGTQESTGVRGRTDLNGGSSSGGGDAIRQPLFRQRPRESCQQNDSQRQQQQRRRRRDKSKRKQIMTRARKHPTVDRIITVLQDKRFSRMTKPTKSRIYNCRCCENKRTS
uniref:Death inducer-obliterator 1 n=1 Tax=Macrostomum lignano TaxID=282301 RepID=A0A1I8FQV1_9PLAT